MASIIVKKRKHMVKHYIRYRVKDDAGIARQHYVPCDDRREARKLLNDVQDSEDSGRIYLKNTPPLLSVPSAGNVAERTVAELMEEYVLSYGLKVWQATTLASNRGIIKNYITPHIGAYRLNEITPRLIQKYIDSLPAYKMVQMPGKKEPGNISPRMVIEIFKLLRPAFDLAVVWGDINNNPTLAAKLPSQQSVERERWTEDEYIHAVSICEDRRLRIAMCLMFAASLRSGELVALTWDNVVITKQSISAGKSHLIINKTMARVSRKELEDTNYRDIYHVFPSVKYNASTVTVLKKNKTEKSKRTVYLPSIVVSMLIEHREYQKKQKEFLGEGYHDYGLVLAQDNGRPYSVDNLSDKFKNFIKMKGLREVDFYSQRHSSSTAKLRHTHNVKAVQGDTGHASANMLQNVYAGIVDEDRINTAAIINEEVFKKITICDSDDNSTSAKGVTAESPIFKLDSS